MSRRSKPRTTSRGRRSGYSYVNEDRDYAGSFDGLFDGEVLEEEEEEEVDSDESFDVELDGELIDDEMGLFDEDDNDIVDATEDPVRMYLMQMGEIPLLTRQQEVTAARLIEMTRTAYRQWMLSTDFMLQGATKLLEQVRDGKLRLDRTIEVSVTNATEKVAIMRRIGPNIKTLRHLLLRNHGDYYTAICKSQPMTERRAAWKRLVCRRNKAVRLIEEMNLRTNRLEPMFNKLITIQNQMLVLKTRIAEAQKSGQSDGTPIEKALRRDSLLDADHLRNPSDSCSPSRSRQRSPLRIRCCQARTLGWKPSIGCFDREKVSQPRPELPRLDPRRQHWSDACSGQV